METVGNNDNKEYANTRDAFFCDGEKQYFKKLLKNKKEQKVHIGLTFEKAEDLHEYAMILIDKVERGEVKEEDMEMVERKIAHCLAAIEDFHIEKVKEMVVEK